LGLRVVALYTRNSLGVARAALGDVDEGRRVMGLAVDAARAAGDRRIEGMSLDNLAAMALLAGDAGEAERLCRKAVALLDRFPPSRATAMARLAQALLVLGRTSEALPLSEAAFQVLQELGSVPAFPGGESLIRLVVAEARHAAGLCSAAVAALCEARDRLLNRASRIQDPDWRESFLANLPENARTLDLVRQWNLEG
jgi:tetratricopeptide (TPR) repeat protein